MTYKEWCRLHAGQLKGMFIWEMREHYKMYLYTKEEVKCPHKSVSIMTDICRQCGEFVPDDYSNMM